MSSKEKAALLLAVTLIVTVVVVGLTLISQSRSAELNLPVGVTLFEDGSVHVDESLQDERAGQWVCAEMGNGVCG